MKKQVIITIILLVATAFITVVYFKNLSTPGMRTSQVMRTIPATAPLIFEFNNDNGFYDIFKGNKLLASVIGEQQINELDVLRHTLLLNPLLGQYFTGQNIFISIHPLKTNGPGLLLTISAGKGFEPDAIEQIAKQPNSGLLVTPLRTNGGGQGFNIYISGLKKIFYVVNTAGNVYSGSFSKELIDQCAENISDKGKPRFVLLSEQQSANSLANLYVDYAQLQPLFDGLFKNNTDIFKSAMLLPGMATLSLNYKTEALMFNGLTTIGENGVASYLSLFVGQHPVVNHLKDIFPSTTAYSVNFAVSDPLKFGADLSKWYEKAGIKKEEGQLFNKVQAETGTDLKSGFNNLIANEFAIITTRYFEKFAIISVKDGSRLKLLMANISKMTDEGSGQLSYEKLPFFLLGDAFSVFRRPYFLIIDNYLVLANSPGELASYYDSYINRKFLSKNDQYNQFDNLLAAQSNVAFLVDFKNAVPILKRDLDPGAYNNFQTKEPGWKNFYLASLQFTAADKNFYTNFSMRLNTDTSAVNNK